ncbi:MAG: hypothetical protein ACI9D5_002300 [Candidatus Endobugula sp.]|jgi:hypothetical protein
MCRYVFALVLSKLKLFFLISLCLGAVACGSGFIYQNLGSVITWYTDSYVVLDEEQKEQLTIIIDEGLAWHKKQELPRYQYYLQNVYTKLDRPLNEEDIRRIQTFASSSFKAVQQRIIPTLLPLFKTLDTEQQQEFWRNLDKKQIKYEKEFLSRSSADYITDLNKQYTTFAERLLGSLTESQELIIANRVGKVIRADDIWLKARRAWLSDVKRKHEALDNEAQTNDSLMRVQAAWINRDQHYSNEDNLKVDERDRQARQLLLAVINSRTDKQTDNFKKFIKNWKNKFSRWQT